MKPINTFSSELLRKVSKSDTYKGLNSDSSFIIYFEKPLAWYSEPIIYIKEVMIVSEECLVLMKNKNMLPLWIFLMSKGTTKFQLTGECI